MNTKSLQNRICEHCNQNFSISEEELVLYKKVGIELPILCFFCRMKQQLSFWMFGKFRKGKSDLSGKSLITVLSEKARYPIYLSTEWFSDEWNALDYGMEYDSSKSFLQQLQELQEKVPHPHQTGKNSKECEWCDDAWNSKNCYLSRSMEGCKDLFYCYRSIDVRNSIDTSVLFSSERCYDSFNCVNSYGIFYSRNSRDCIDSRFLYDCRNCQSCFMCWNLRNKFHCIENIQYSKEEYEEKLKSFNLGSYQSIEIFKKRFDEIIKNNVVHRQNFNLKTYDSDGDYLLNVKNCHNCHTISNGEDCYNIIRADKVKSNIDISGSSAEMCGSCSACWDGAYGMKYSSWSPSRYSEYCDFCIECEYCFGCVGLRKKKFCILNKQYTKESFDKLRTRIIADMEKRGEYGKFLPYSMSAGPFNLSTGFLYFPNTKKEDILKLGGYWEDTSVSHIEGIPTSELPDHINDVTDAIITEALICPESGWRFNIAKDELAFYRQNNIPLPRYHFDVRTKKQLKYMTVLQPYPYKCFYCKKDIMAYYPPEWDYQKIACEECYKQNIA